MWLIVRALLGAVGIGLTWQTYSKLEPLGRMQRDDSWASVVMHAGLYLRDAERITESDRVGAFNAGRLGFVLEGRVVNLDGLANDSIRKDFSSWRDYFAREKITYYCDVAHPSRLRLKYELLMEYDIDHPAVDKLYVARILE